MNRLEELFPTQLKIIQRPRQAGRRAVELDNKLQVAVHICRPTVEARTTGPRWVLTRNRKEDDLVSLICLSDKPLTGFSDFYVVPEIGSLIRKYKVLHEGHPLLKTGKRLESLSQFYDAAKEIAEHWKPQDDLITSGDTVFNERASRLYIAGKEISLSRIETLMFKKLIQRTGAPIPIQELVTFSSKPNVFLVRSHIKELREKLGRRLRRRLITVVNKGYMYKGVTFS
jgi:hypothetical protein